MSAADGRIIQVSGVKVAPHGRLSGQAGQYSMADSRHRRASGPAPLHGPIVFFDVRTTRTGMCEIRPGSDDPIWDWVEQDSGAACSPSWTCPVAERVHGLRHASLANRRRHKVANSGGRLMVKSLMLHSDSGDEQPSGTRDE
jgi:hypothetical protein